jgi:hypothetical protein
MDQGTKKRFISNYESMGGDRFYGSLIRYSVQRLADDKAQRELEELNRKDGKTTSDIAHKPSRPEIVLMEHSAQFLTYYRREKLEVYREISAHFRRAANKIYRLMLKQHLIGRNSKFLNLVG